MGIIANNIRFYCLIFWWLLFFVALGVTVGGIIGLVTQTIQMVIEKVAKKSIDWEKFMLIVFGCILGITLGSCLALFSLVAINKGGYW